MKIETIVEKFDRMAEEFRQDTGFIAPGKDVPPDKDYSIDQNLERAHLYRVWIKGYHRGQAYYEDEM